MKKGIIFSGLLWFLLVLAKTSVGQVQLCPVFQHYEQGTQLTYEHFDAKNKLIKRTFHIVASNIIEAGYHTIRFDQTTRNNKGIVIKHEEVIFYCKENVIYLNPIHNIPQEAYNGMENLEYEADYKLMALPFNDLAFDSLPEIDLSMSLGQPGTGAIMDLQFLITDRRIGQKDSISINNTLFHATPFEYQTTTRTKILIAKKTYEYSHIDWYDTKRALLLKSEIRNKNGKSLGYSVLSVYEKK